MTDWREAERRLDDTETRMAAVLDERELTDLVTSITSLSAVGAATILAQIGDLTHFATARAVVKHAGLAPQEKISGTYSCACTATGSAPPVAITKHPIEPGDAAGRLTCVACLS